MNSNKWIALVDINNAYVSMERLFDPALHNKPVVVLSNNDGCIVSRSQEVKDLGISMAAPVFKMKDIIRKNNIIVRSSNYALYGDISNRYTETLRQFTPKLEVYSIDESFLDLTGFKELESYGRKIKDTIAQNIGLPVCVGIGRTKTLAKLANRIAKKNGQYDGVCLLPDDNDDILRGIEVRHLWGIARATTEKLAALGILSAYNLKHADRKMIRRNLSVVAEKTVLELNGVQCLEFELVTPENKAVMVSRSFGKKISSYEALRQAIAAYTSRGAEKIRKQGLTAHKITVFVRTSPFDKTQKAYENSFSMVFPENTADTKLMIKTAAYCLKKIFIDGLIYYKAGILLDGLESADRTQTDFFHKPAFEENSKLMGVIDSINKVHGRDMLHLGSVGIKQGWAMRQENKSQKFTTCWTELPTVK